MTQEDLQAVKAQLLGQVKADLLADADFVGKFLGQAMPVLLEQVASKARPVVVADVKKFAVAVLKKVGVYGPYVLGALGGLGHFVLGVL